MFSPTKVQVSHLLNDYKTVPVFYEVLGDRFTPIQIFMALRQKEVSCFILESVEDKEQWGRYSFIGICPKSEIKIYGKRAVIDGKEQELEDPIAYLTRLAQSYDSPLLNDRPKLTGGLIGYFGYDTIRLHEERLIHMPEDDLHLPDCHLCMYDEIIAFDHLKNKVIVIQNIYREDDLDLAYEEKKARAEALISTISSYHEEMKEKKDQRDVVVTSNITKEEYEHNVETAKEHIRQGDIFQVVLSQRFQVETKADPFDVYRCLRAANPSPYLYFFDYVDHQIVGASPEMLVNVTNGIVTTKPIAGTVPRGETPQEDAKLERALLHDPKERAEHTMLVDLGRNDVGRVCKFGSVNVEKFMSVEKYSQVTHLVSDVKGRLRDDKTTVDALMSVLPAGTLSGAPKIRAMEIIDELENRKRGLYGGTVGYLAFDGNIDTCIAIRTVLFQKGIGYVQAGAGIVADSVPEKEFEETKHKAQAVINAIEEAGKL